MRTLALAAVLTATACLATARAADAVSAYDKAFVAKVSQGGTFEVMAGRLAETQGSTQDIKDQGSTEAHDHQLVGDKLKSIATGLDLPFPATLDPTFQKELDDLKAKTGTAFDAAYLQDMVDIHNKDGAAFSAEVKSGTNPQLKAFAAETYRIVLRHEGELKAKVPGKV